MHTKFVISFPGLEPCDCPVCLSWGLEDSLKNQIRKDDIAPSTWSYHDIDQSNAVLTQPGYNDLLLDKQDMFVCVGVAFQIVFKCINLLLSDCQKYGSKVWKSENHGAADNRIPYIELSNNLNYI